MNQGSASENENVVAVLVLQGVERLGGIIFADRLFRMTERVLLDDPHTPSGRAG